MGEHYYTQTPGSASDRRELTLEFRERTYRFATDSGVFSRGKLDKGTEVLLRAPYAAGEKMLDMCCGWGPIGIVLAAENPGARVFLRDINTRAVALARENIRLNRLSNAEADAGDGFEGLEDTYDCIFMNPPVRAGKSLIYGLFDEAFAHLRAQGSLYIVIRKAQGAPSAKAYLEALFGQHRVETINRQGGYHVLRARKG